MDRYSFIFYKSFAKALGKLPDAEYTVLMRAIMAYAFDGTEPELDGICDAMWELIRPQIDANNARYENGKKGADYGRFGGRPKTDKKQENAEEQIQDSQNEEEQTENPKETPNKPQWGFENNPSGVLKNNPKETPNENVNENENVNVNEKEEVKKGGYGGKTTPPPKRENTALTAFLSECNVMLDNYDGALMAGMDFEKLTAAYRESEDWLMVRQECRFFSWVCRRYSDILAGKYKTNKKASRNMPVGGSITGKFNALLRELCDG